MNPRPTPRLMAAGTVALWLASAVLALSLGASGLSWADLANALLASPSPTRGDDHQLARTVLLAIRLPRVLVAMLCGGALAAAGVLSQGLFRNALASPSVLGTEAGGSLAAVLVVYLGPAFASALALPAAAATGALLATVLVFRMGARGASLATLLLMGLALTTWLGAGTSLVVSLSLEDHRKSAAIMYWLLGGFGGKGWEHVAMVLAPLALGLVLAARLAPRLDVLTLGEEVASSLSLDLARLRRHATLGIAVLVGGAVAAAGALPFVGLVVPHLTRLIAGPGHRRLLVLSTINGMTLTLLADLLARTIRAPAELEVGIVTSLLGAPCFLWLLTREAREVSR